MALTSRINFSLLSTLTNAIDLGTAQIPVALDKTYSLASGTGADQGDMVWADRRTLAASATEDLDFAASLTNLLTGASMTFARLKGIAVLAATTNTNNVNITRPASNGVGLFLAAGDGLAVTPGGLFVLVAPNATGYAVTADSGDLLTFTNSAGTTEVVYDIVVIGASA